MDRIALAQIVMSQACVDVGGRLTDGRGGGCSLLRHSAMCCVHSSTTLASIPPNMWLVFGYMLTRLCDCFCLSITWPFDAGGIQPTCTTVLLNAETTHSGATDYRFHNMRSLVTLKTIHHVTHYSLTQSLTHSLSFSLCLSVCLSVLYVGAQQQVGSGVHLVTAPNVDMTGQRMFTFHQASTICQTHGLFLPRSNDRSHAGPIIGFGLRVYLLFGASLWVRSDNLPGRQRGIICEVPRKS